DLIVIAKVMEEESVFSIPEIEYLEALFKSKIGILPFSKLPGNIQSSLLKAFFKIFFIGMAYQKIYNFDWDEENDNEEEK
ncbi:MAG: hypothetical protein ABH800_01900, partial [Candidatus Nealsonbacteria bacterium]